MNVMDKIFSSPCKYAALAKKSRKSGKKARGGRKTKKTGKRGKVTKKTARRGRKGKRSHTRRHRGGAHSGSEFIPVEADWMSHESARLEMLERAGAVPGALALRVDHGSVTVVANSEWTAQAAADRNGLSFGRDFQGPTSEEFEGVIGF